MTAKRRHSTKNVERLHGTELAPLGESGGTVQLENLRGCRDSQRHTAGRLMPICRAASKQGSLSAERRTIRVGGTCSCGLLAFPRIAAKRARSRVAMMLRVSAITADAHASALFKQFCRQSKPVLPLAAINCAAASAHAIPWLLVSKKTGFRGIYDERSPTPVHNLRPSPRGTRTDW